MKHLRKIIDFKLSLVLIAVFMLGGFMAGAVNAESNATEDLLPEYSEYKWNYHGVTGYGHEMKISSIMKVNNEVYYAIDGSVYDASGGESDADYSLSLSYIVKPEVLIQVKSAEMMLDSKYDRIELIRGPLEEGASWTQEVGSEETPTMLESTITNVETDEDGNKVYAVLYEDINSTYYEKRKIKANAGVIYFEKIMLDQSSDYVVSYSIHEEATGVTLENQYNDVSRSSWYMDYVPPLTSLNIIHGYLDNAFKPDSDVTVAEFIKLTLHSLSYIDEMSTEIWYEPYVEQAIELNLITSDEYDNYDRPITREEMTKIIVKAYGKSPKSGETEFNDSAEMGAEYKAYVNAATELGIIEGYPSDNTFRPKDLTTRAEASKMFFLLVKEDGQADFNAEAALEQEDELTNRLYQNESEGWKVENFDTKEALIQHVMQVLDNRELVTKYVDRFYKEEDDGIYFLAQDGLTVINENKPYKFVVINPREAKLIQENENALRGHYKLIVTFQYDNNEWVMKNRETIRYGSSSSDTVYYEVLSQEEFSEELQNKIDSIKEQRGYARLTTDAEGSVLYIGSGQKSTGGHTITVQAAKSIEGTSQIFVQETVPDPNEAVSQVITYPMTVIKPYNLETNIELITTNSAQMNEIQTQE